jgi:hypothetical protein
MSGENILLGRGCKFIAGDPQDFHTQGGANLLQEASRPRGRLMVPPTRGRRVCDNRGD